MGAFTTVKIGIFGGTFNPIHTGHLINAEYLRQEFGLDRILFVPANMPVHKHLAGQVSADDRMNMVERAIAGHSAFAASRIEIDRTEPSYTITTVRQLREHYHNDELFLVIGGDSLAEIHTWKDVGELVDLVPIIVMRRHANDQAMPAFKGGYRMGSNPLIDISSTMVRDMVRRGFGIRYMVPDSVQAYIEERGLYRH